MKKPVWIGLAVVAIIAGGIWWATPSTAEVEFDLSFSATSGCLGNYPGLGLVTGYAELVLRDNDNKKVATVPMRESAATNKLSCHMVGIAEIPVLDVYKVEVHNFDKSIGAGFIDRDQVESGYVRISNP